MIVQSLKHVQVAVVSVALFGVNALATVSPSVCWQSYSCDTAPKLTLLYFLPVSTRRTCSDAKQTCTCGVTVHLQQEFTVVSALIYMHVCLLQAATTAVSVSGTCD